MWLDRIAVSLYIWPPSQYRASSLLAVAVGRRGVFREDRGCDDDDDNRRLARALCVFLSSRALPTLVR